MATPLVSVQIDVGGLEKRVLQVSKDIAESARMAIEPTAAECVAALEARAPSHEEEYDAIMRGNNGVDLIPLDGDQSAMTEHSSRIRFLRAPGIWLKELVSDPGNVIVNEDEFSVQLGNLAVLMEKSRFSWINAGKKGASMHTLQDGTFYVLEFGETITVHATNAKRLAPDDIKAHRHRSMTKSFAPGFRIYSGFNSAIFVEGIRSRLRW